MDDTFIDANADPFELFETWMAEAEQSEPNDPNAMALATSTLQGAPSLRMILLKGADRRGFVFYTNLESRKGSEIAVNPQAALLFHWKSLRRQIRIEGVLSAVSNAEADSYFASRRHISQLGAIASDQSRPLPERSVFEERLNTLMTRYPEGSTVPRPANWSGFRLTPKRMEFWQDRDFRLHDRCVWTLTGNTWTTERLYP